MINRRIRRLGLLCLLSCLQEVVAEDSLPSILDLQSSYLEANGGLFNIQALSSLIASGHVINAEGEGYDFKLYRKRPNMMSTQIDFGYASSATVFNGREAFRIISSPRAADQVIDIEGAEADQIEADSTLDGPFFQLIGQPEWLEVISESEVNGVLAYEIAISEAAGSRYERLWISQEHHQEVKLTRVIENETSEPVIEEIYFSDFDQIRGVWLAKDIRYEREGVLIQRVVINRVRANVGIFDSFFAKPKSPKSPKN